MESFQNKIISIPNLYRDLMVQRMYRYRPAERVVLCVDATETTKCGGLRFPRPRAALCGV